MTQTNSITALAPNKTVANHPTQSPEKEQGQSLVPVDEACSLSRLGLAFGKRIGRSAWIYLNSSPGDTTAPSPAPGSLVCVEPAREREMFPTGGVAWEIAMKHD